MFKSSLLFLSIIMGNIVIAGEHSDSCSLHDLIIFHCDMQNGKQSVLCASVSDTGEITALQYRFLAKAGEEVEFPKEKTGPLTLFSYNHYSRFMTDYTEIKFNSAEHSYNIFRYYDETSNKPVQAGVIVSRKLSEDVVLEESCTKLNVDRLQRLPGKLKCDENSALGCN